MVRFVSVLSKAGGIRASLPIAMPADGDWLDGSGLDELAQCGFGNTDMATDAGEPDAPLSDEPPGEPRLGAENLGSLLKRQEPIDSGPCVLARLLRLADLLSSRD